MKLRSRGINVGTGSLAFQSSSFQMMTWDRISYDAAAAFGGGFNALQPGIITIPLGADIYELNAHIDALPQTAGGAGAGTLHLHIFREPYYVLTNEMGQTAADGNGIGFITLDGYFHESVQLPLTGGPNQYVNPPIATTDEIPTCNVLSLPFNDTSGNSTGGGSYTLTFDDSITTDVITIDPSNVQTNLQTALTASLTDPHIKVTGDPALLADTRIAFLPPTLNYGAYGGPNTIVCNIISASHMTIGGKSSGSFSLTRVGERLCVPIIQNTGLAYTIPRSRSMWVTLMAEQSWNYSNSWKLPSGNDWSLGASITPVADPPFCYGTARIIDGQTNPRSGVTYHFQQVEAGATGYISSPDPFSAVSDAGGNLQDAAAVAGDYSGITFELLAWYTISTDGFFFDPKTRFRAAASNFQIPGNVL